MSSINLFSISFLISSNISYPYRLQVEQSPLKSSQYMYSFPCSFAIKVIQWIPLENSAWNFSQSAYLISRRYLIDAPVLLSVLYELIITCALSLINFLNLCNFSLGSLSHVKEGFFIGELPSPLRWQWIRAFDIKSFET